jgi:radical SAM protein with 4Fe4S-binding SPASM domain
MRPADFQLILNQLSHHPITEAKLMGMGEPFMHPQFDDICWMFKDMFPNCNVISATNGQIKLSLTMIKALEYIDTCYISIDGYMQNYEEIRIGASWFKLIKFLRELADIKENVNCKFPINYTVTPGNVYDIDKMFELIDIYNLDELRLNFVQNWTEGQTNTELNGFTQEQFEYLKQYKQYFKGKTPWDYSDCFWVKNGIYVTVDGNMKVCCMNTSAKSIGNVFQQPIALLQASKAFNDISRGCANNTPTDHCKNCSYKELVPFLTKIHEA